MSPHIRVLAGTGTTLTPITHLVNTTKAFSLVSERFEGQVVVCIKGFTGSKTDAYDYFKHPERQGTTWSIQVRGRFLENISADNVLFGSTFDRQLKFPERSEKVLDFLSNLDPTVGHDLTSQTHPWVLSPLISTMPYFAHKRIAPERGDDPLQMSKNFPEKAPISDDTSQLHLARRDAPLFDTGSLLYGTAFQRRVYFATAEHRQEITFGPKDILTTDISNGFLDFDPSLTLRLHGGLSFDLTQGFDGQPARFVCCKRKSACGPDSDDGGLPWGQVFWTVVVEVVKE